MSSIARNQAFLFVNVMGLVVQHHEIVDLTDDLREVDHRVGRLGHGLGAEEIIGRILVVDRGLFCRSLEHPVDVGEEQVALFSDVADGILDMDGQLEIVLPVLPFVAVVRQQRIIEKDARALEIETQPIENDDVWRDDKEIGRKVAVRLVELMEIAPRHQQRHDLGLAGAGGELEHVTSPVGKEHVPRHRAARIEPHQAMGIPRSCNLVEPNRAFDRFALGEVPAERARLSRRPAG